MGLFYTNLVLRGPNQAQLGTYLTELGRTAYISPTVGDITVVYDRECENQDYEVLTGLAKELSKRFRCPALVAYLHDDDIFWYGLYQDGQFLDEYDSTPDYFSTDTEAEEIAPPRGGDATLLCTVFGATERIAEVDRLLHYFVPGDEPPDDMPLPEDRHIGVVAALGFPPFAASIGHDGIAHDLDRRTRLFVEYDGVARPLDSGPSPFQGFIKVAPAA